MFDSLCDMVVGARSIPTQILHDLVSIKTPWRGFCQAWLCERSDNGGWRECWLSGRDCPWTSRMEMIGTWLSYLYILAVPLHTCRPKSKTSGKNLCPPCTHNLWGCYSSRSHVWYSTSVRYTRIEYSTGEYWDG